MKLLKAFWLQILILLFLPIALAANPLPEFTSQSENDWINTKPLTLMDLKGKVVLIEIWTSI